MMAKPTIITETSPALEAEEAPSEAKSMPGAGAMGWADERLGLAKLGRASLRKDAGQIHPWQTATQASREHSS